MSFVIDFRDAETADNVRRQQQPNDPTLRKRKLARTFSRACYLLTARTLTTEQKGSRAACERQLPQTVRTVLSVDKELAEFHDMQKGRRKKISFFTTVEIPTSAIRVSRSMGHHNQKQQKIQITRKDAGINTFQSTFHCH